MENICNDSTLLGILSIVKKTMGFIQIIVPMLLIIWSGVAFIKLIKNPEEKKGIKKIINQFLAAAIIFFIPLFLNITMNLVGNNTKFSSCWNKASSKIKIGKKYFTVDNQEKKKFINSTKGYEKGQGFVKMKYNNAKKIVDSALKNASNSDPSIVITDATGNVLAQRKPHILREGASTTKVFTGYAAVKLLDVENDKVTGTQHIIDYIGEYNSYPVAPGQSISVIDAATRGFPDSCNSGSESIAVALGYKYHSCSSDAEAHKKGTEEINKLAKSIGCKETNLRNGSGLGTCWTDANHKDVCTYGHSANDLSIVTIEAMKDENFVKSYVMNSNINHNYENARLAENVNRDGLFFIKSGTGAYCHGVWGFNKGGKRYYIAMLGINCNGGDDKYTVIKDLYQWSITSLIK